MFDSRRVMYITIVAFFCILSGGNVFVQSESNTKEIPAVTRFDGSKFMGPTLRFEYCYSCGYQKAFQEYGSIIQQKYPEIVVEGDNYNPNGANMYLAKFLGALKMLFIVCILSSANIFTWIGQPEAPAWWTWCITNKLYSCMMLFFLCNAIEGQLISSGAFEIYFNDVPVWSKLDTGRIPQPPELFQIIDNQLQFQGKVELKPGFAK